MTDIINYLISFYITMLSSTSYQYVENIPKPKYTLDRQYNFVQYDKNIIINPYSKTFQYFRGAVDDLLEGRRKKINIVHIGDSHIQADYFSDRVRSHFNDEILLGNGGRGYFFPCSMAKTHNPFNLKVTYNGNWNGCQTIQYKKSCSWGLGGMTASTIDSTARFTIDPNARSKHKYPITRARVYYRVSDPTSYSVKLKTTEGELSPTRLDARGYAEFEFENPQDLVNFSLKKEYAQQTNFTLEGIVLSHDEVGVQYHAVGVNGATVYSFLKAPKLEDHLRSLNPDLVIVSLGTNDAYTTRFNGKNYKHNLAKLVQKIKNATPHTSILLTTPPDCAIQGRWNYSNKVAVAKIREIAEEADCAVWDLFNVMGGLGSVDKWFGNQMTAGDKVHFTGKGYRLQGDLLYDALILDYARYRLGDRLVVEENE